MQDSIGVSDREIQALVSGTTDPAKLAELARGRLHHKLPLLREALAGHWRPHHAFLLSRLLADLDYLEEASRELAARIEEQLAPFTLEFERLLTIPGVQRRTAAVMVAEIGTDMNCFPTLTRLVSWPGKCPSNDESAGKRRRAKSRRGDRRLRVALVEAALGAIRTKGTALGALYRRLRTPGPQACAAGGCSPHFGDRLPPARTPNHLPRSRHRLLRSLAGRQAQTSQPRPTPAPRLPSDSHIHLHICSITI